MSVRVIPFANGYEYDAWTERNCDICPLRYKKIARRFDCEIEEALTLAAIDDGTISQEIADAMGWTVDRIDQPGWPCKKRLELDQKPLPEDQVMKALGAPTLF